MQHNRMSKVKEDEVRFTNGCKRKNHFNELDYKLYCYHTTA